MSHEAFDNACAANSCRPSNVLKPADASCVSFAPLCLGVCAVAEQLRSDSIRHELRTNIVDEEGPTLIKIAWDEAGMVFQLDQ